MISQTKKIAEIKPKLRGIQHLVMAPIAFLAGLFLAVFSPSLERRISGAVYLLGAITLFGVSAIYHLGRWRPGVKQVLRRIDHSNIFVFIAASYTPLTVAMLTGVSRVRLLVLIWCCAGAGVLMKIFWLSAPRWIYTLIYVGMGWAALGWLGEFWSVGGAAVVWLLVAGGLCYTVGALCYAAKRPNLWPTWYGYHEIMHSGTVLGAITHFVAIVMVTFAQYR